LERITAFCGIDCASCKAFIATRENDDVKRREIAAEWSKAFGLEIKPEEVNCDGCLTKKGRHINYCNVCEIRQCGMKKAIENCAYCTDYACEKLQKFHEQAPEPKNRLEEIRKQSEKTKKTS